MNIVWWLMGDLIMYWHENNICAGDICVGTKVWLDIDINIYCYGFWKAIGIDLHEDTGHDCAIWLFGMSIDIWKLWRCFNSTFSPTCSIASIHVQSCVTQSPKSQQPEKNVIWYKFSISTTFWLWTRSF